MNAMAKGAALGIYSKSKASEGASLAGSQPYVDLMGRRYAPIYPYPLSLLYVQLLINFVEHTECEYTSYGDIDMN